jgi:hypothetical protein
MSKQKKGCEVGACQGKSRAGHVYTRARVRCSGYSIIAGDGGCRARAERDEGAGAVPKGAAPSPNVFDVHARERDPSGCPFCMYTRSRSRGLRPGVRALFFQYEDIVLLKTVVPLRRHKSLDKSRAQPLSLSVESHTPFVLSTHRHWPRHSPLRCLHSSLKLRSAPPRSAPLSDSLPSLSQCRLLVHRILPSRRR